MKNIPRSRGPRLAGWGRPHAGGSAPAIPSVQGWRPCCPGDGDRGGDPVDPPHTKYPARRTLVCRAARLIAGPSTNGLRFVFSEASCAHRLASHFGGWCVPGREPRLILW